VLCAAFVWCIVESHVLSFGQFVFHLAQWAFVTVVCYCYDNDCEDCVDCTGDDCGVAVVVQQSPECKRAG